MGPDFKTQKSGLSWAWIKAWQCNMILGKFSGQFYCSCLVAFVWFQSGWFGFVRLCLSWVMLGSFQVLVWPKNQARFWFLSYCAVPQGRSNPKTIAEPFTSLFFFISTFILVYILISHRIIPLGSLFLILLQSKWMQLINFLSEKRLKTTDNLK